MMMDQATAMETLRRVGFEVRWEMVDGKLQEGIPMDAVFRLCDLTGTPKAARLKAALKKQFCGKKKH